MSRVIFLVSLLIQIYEFLVLIRVLLSWVAVDLYRSRYGNPILRLLYQLTDPILVPLQRIIPPIGGAIDLSPVVALILLEIARRVIVTFLARL
jgi:YggT family protein